MKRIFRHTKELFGGLCCVLACAVAALGTTSFAKYADEAQHSSQAGVSGLVSSVEVDSVDSRSFNNGEYFLDSNKNIRMNFVRTVGFSVKNYDGTSVSPVPMEYELVFYAPQVFAGRLALQLLDDTGKKALLPQILLPSLIAAGENGTQYVTNNADGYDSVTVDVNGNVVADKNFTVEKKGEKSYLATAIDGGVTVRVSPETRTLKQTVSFRFYNVSGHTSVSSPTVNREMGVVLPPLMMEYTTEVPCYRIAVQMPSFQFSAGVNDSHSYFFSLAPIESLSNGTLQTLQDDVLGGQISASALGTYTAPKFIYGGENGSSVVVGDTEFTIGKLYYQISVESGETETVEYTQTSPFALYEGGRQIYYLSECFSKTYPCTVSAKFTQLSGREV